MGAQIDIEDLLDAANYPDAPGWKARETSRAAAEAIAPKAATIRERVYAALKVQPGTPEQIAKRIGETVMNVRPRCSQLSAAGLIEDSGTRGQAMGGRNAIVWQVRK